MLTVIFIIGAKLDEPLAMISYCFNRSADLSEFYDNDPLQSRRTRWKDLDNWVHSMYPFLLMVFGQTSHLFTLEVGCKRFAACRRSRYGLYLNKIFTIKMLQFGM